MSVLHRVLTARTSEPLTLTGREVNQLQHEIRELHAPAGLTARESLLSLESTLAEAAGSEALKSAKQACRVNPKIGEHMLGQHDANRAIYALVHTMLQQPEFAERKLLE